jgi:hypothetical protein
LIHDYKLNKNDNKSLAEGFKDGIKIPKRQSLKAKLSQETNFNIQLSKNDE